MRRLLPLDAYTCKDKSMFFLPQNEQTLPCLCLQDKQHKRKAAAAVLPVRVGDEGMALESSFKDGLKHEVLRSLCQLVNSSELALEVCLTTCQQIIFPEQFSSVSSSQLC